MSVYDQVKIELKRAPKTWLVTGVAGFIGSSLLETLLGLDQRVVGLDDFSTGYRRNLEEVKARVTAPRWSAFTMVEGSIADPQICRCACDGADFVLHQAALGSVPASIANPVQSHSSNVTGFLNILVAAREAKVGRVVYASSSAVYGDDEKLPKTEESVGRPLSPYAATKWMDEIYAGVSARVYDYPGIGLRYFNVFGPRQDPQGAYAAVIPKWIAALLKREPVFINGDGETSRDFCYIENVVQANLLAATTKDPLSINQAYNIALGKRTTLNGLFALLLAAVRRLEPELPEQKPVYREFRSGDIRHSVADISKARRLLGYDPTHDIDRGLDLAMDWYRKNLSLVPASMP
jgi:UDP-N-acetylglucosamine/UDP-N-acetyl-alpha-D-glucosaminouronate 4-epimerase